MEDSCKYIEKAVAENRQGTVLHLWGWARGYQLLVIKEQHVTKCNNGTRICTDCLE